MPDHVTLFFAHFYEVYLLEKWNLYNTKRFLIFFLSFLYVVWYQAFEPFRCIFPIKKKKKKKKTVFTDRFLNLYLVKFGSIM